MRRYANSKTNLYCCIGRFKSTKITIEIIQCGKRNKYRGCTVKLLQKLTIREISTDIGIDTWQVHKILHDHLGVNKVLACRVS